MAHTLPFDDPPRSYREKLALYLHSTEAALKAWETRRAGGGGKKDKPASTTTVSKDDRPHDPKEAHAVYKKMQTLEAELVAKKSGTTGGAYYSGNDSRVKDHVNDTLTAPTAKQFDTPTMKSAINGLRITSVYSDFPNDVAKHLTSEIVSSWASSSGDSDPTSVEMQFAAQKEFDLDKAKINTNWDNVRSTNKGTPLKSGPLSEKQNEDARKVGRSVLRTMYDNTQAEFKKLGITELTLYRGTKLGAEHVKDGQAIVRTQPMSSWSTSFSTAKGFYKSAMLAVRVPVEKVVGSYLTGYGCRSEHEVVILGDEYKVFASKTYPESEDSFTKQVNTAMASKGTPASGNWKTASSGLTPGQKAAATKKANKAAAAAMKVDQGDPLEFSDDFDEQEPDLEPVNIDEDWREADWPKVNGDAGSGIPPGLIDERGNLEEIRNLSSRVEMAAEFGVTFTSRPRAKKLSEAFHLERDQREAALKAWDTMGRKDKKPAGHNVTSVNGDANDAVEEHMLGVADGAEAFGKAMLEDIDENTPGGPVTFTVAIKSYGEVSDDGDREYQNDYDSYVENERERIDEAHEETRISEHGDAYEDAMNELEDVWTSFQVVQDQVYPRDPNTPTLPVDPPFERPEVKLEDAQQMFKDLKIDLDRPSRGITDLDNEKISAYMQEHAEAFAGKTFPSFDRDTMREWSDDEGGYWGEESGFSNWTGDGQASDPDYDSISTYEDWVDESGLRDESSGGTRGTIEWNIKGDDGTSITRTMYVNGDGEKEVHHDYFRAGPPSKPKSGMGKDAMRGMLREYERVGVEKITVHAALQQGGYAWARYGFLPNNMEGVADDIEYTVRNMRMDEGARTVLKDLLNNHRDDPKTLWKIADMRIGDHRIGHEILAGQDWHGYFDMNDPEQVARFKNYVGDKK